MNKKAAYWPGLLLAFSVFTQPIALSAGTITFASGVRQNTMIELFTSEGCSSCPPAEVYLNSFTANPRLWKDFFPVAWHVDYWDYLGWRDRFASPGHADRQRQYARERRSPTVYTPAFFLNGRSWRPGWSSKAPGTDTRKAGTLRLVLANRSFQVDFKPGQETGAEHKLHVAILGFGLRTRIKAGENAGRYSAHEFVLLGKAGVTRAGKGEWSGELPAELSIHAPKYGLLAWVSSGKSLAPLQVIGGYLPGGLFPAPK